MRHGPPIIVRIIVIVALLGAAAYWFFFMRPAEADGRLLASGTIEATQVVVSPEMGGRISSVTVQAGDPVAAGQPLAQLDTTLLEAQLAQTQAGLRAAEASYDLLAAGPSAAQLAAAEAAVTRAQASLDSLNEQLATAEADEAEARGQVEELTEQIAEANATPTNPQSQAALSGLNAQLTLAQQALAAKVAQIALLESQLSVAEAGLDASQAQLTLAQEGPRPQQLAAAQAQVETARAAVHLLETQIGRQTLTAPIDGVVLGRMIEPGEVVAPGATLLVLGQLDQLTITVYVPEDRYGVIRVGQTASILVDSFPGEEFTGTVRHIADQAEFTPRNVQTAEGRSSTVFAIELFIGDGRGQLKPGMPADVDFGRGNSGNSGN
ncbi:MAG: efflux RND transporter periplasmic adaptor subunit [Chloroflexota bacterium]